MFPALEAVLARLSAWPDLARDVRGLALREGEAAALAMATLLARCAELYAGRVREDRVRWGDG